MLTTVGTDASVKYGVSVSLPIYHLSVLSAWLSIDPSTASGQDSLDALGPRSLDGGSTPLMPSVRAPLIPEDRASLMPLGRVPLRVKGDAAKSVCRVPLREI